VDKLPRQVRIQIQGIFVSGQSPGAGPRGDYLEAEVQAAVTGGLRGRKRVVSPAAAHAVVAVGPGLGALVDRMGVVVVPAGRRHGAHGRRKRAWGLLGAMVVVPWHEDASHAIGLARRWRGRGRGVRGPCASLLDVV
jgi:hypothetical protein